MQEGLEGEGLLHTREMFVSRLEDAGRARAGRERERERERGRERNTEEEMGSRKHE
jgi:hypothetical protein